MNPWSPHLYNEFAVAADADAATIANALQQARTLQQQGLPAILTLKHLAVQVHVPYRRLRQIVERRLDKPYRFFRMKKRGGGYRLICVPERDLFRVQKWLARNVVSQAVPHPSSCAYLRGRSIVDCASQHCGCRWLIKLDVRQFFESISERQVYYAYRGLGYQPLVSFELARLCTRVSERAERRYKKSRWRNEKAREDHTIDRYRCWHVGHLPQGAPTSPSLSNLVMRRFDGRVSARAIEMGLVYTRYADDLILSTSDRTFTRERAMLAIKTVFDELRDEGLRPHTTKTHISPPGARKIVLGLLVDGNMPRLTREFRAKLEQHIYCLSQNGPAIHAYARDFRSIHAMKRHIAGLLNYAQQIDPAFATPLIGAFNAVDWPF